jgi:hypothetical protein
MVIWVRVKVGFETLENDCPDRPQWRSNPVSGRSLPKTGVFQVCARDYRPFLLENAANRSLETGG